MEEATQISRLFEGLQQRFPFLVEKIEAFLAESGLHEPYDGKLEFGSPSALTEISTFDLALQRQLSPMLHARFTFAGGILFCHEELLSLEAIVQATVNEEVLSTHNSLREHWEGSAPMQFSDRQLSVFAKQRQALDGITYFVWPDDRVEPEIWQYASMQENRYANLAEWITRKAQF